MISTGLLTDARLRPELSAIADHIATWADKVPSLPEGMARNALIDAHPYLGPSFDFQEKVRPLHMTTSTGTNMLVQKQHSSTAASSLRSRANAGLFVRAY